MGFETIYLLGCDCNYNLQKSADFSDSYFYSISDIPGDDYSNIQRQKDEGLFAGFEAVFESSYSTVKRYFEQHDRQIFNAGINGKLEVFPRVDFDSLF
ncbi:MAG: hypothetical protein SWE60_01285 [Thermodesulfobacteriota bacterium]|nr:hypothetical protein [Thermodesulfobacteriota bacterium]